MPSHPRRFLVELAVAATSALLAGLTLAGRNWIEVAFGVDPDRGSGSLEWAIVGLTVTLTLVALALARAEWGRRPAESG
jgi:hypothetical protein